jgi:hypothetical protein
MGGEDAGNSLVIESLLGHEFTELDQARLGVWTGWIGFLGIHGLPLETAADEGGRGVAVVGHADEEPLLCLPTQP